MNTKMKYPKTALTPVAEDAVFADHSRVVIGDGSQVYRNFCGGNSADVMGDAGILCMKA